MALNVLTKIGKGVTSWFKVKGATHARFLEDKLSDTVSVLDYGAVSGGSIDCTEAFRKAILSGKHIIVPSGRYLIRGTLTVPESGLNLSGVTYKDTILTCYEGFDVFRVGKYVNISDITIEQTGGYQGSAFSTEVTDSGSAQMQFCTFNRVRVKGFNYGWWLRASLYNSWYDCISENLIGVCFDRNYLNKYSNSNHNAPADWNIFSPVMGWFHNVGSMTTCSFRDRQAGVFGCPMGYTFNSVTFEKNNAPLNEITLLPNGAPATGIYLQGGKSGGRTNFSNSIINPYIEQTTRPFYIEGYRSIDISNPFVQCGTPSNPISWILECNNALVNVKSPVGLDYCNYRYKVTNNGTVVAKEPFQGTVRLLGDSIVETGGEVITASIQDYYSNYSLTIPANSSVTTDIEVPSNGLVEIIGDYFQSGVAKGVFKAIASGTGFIDTLGTSFNDYLSISMVSRKLVFTWKKEQEGLVRVTVGKVSGVSEPF